MAQKRLLKEHAQYQTSPSEFTEILSLGPCENNLFEWEATISPKPDSRHYHGGSWKLAISIPQTYPKEPPTVKFLLPIIHPNVNQTSGEVCLDILKLESWSPAWNLRYIVGAVLLLLDEPEPDSPLNIDAANMYRNDLLAFKSVVEYNMWKHNQLVNTRTDSGKRISMGSATYSDTLLNTEKAASRISSDTVSEAIRDAQLSKQRSAMHSPDFLLQELRIMGDQVTKQFIAKAKEISLYRDDLAPVIENVAQAVTRQLDQVLAQAAIQQHDQRPALVLKD